MIKIAELEATIAMQPTEPCFHAEDVAALLRLARAVKRFEERVGDDEWYLSRGVRRALAAFDFTD